jgi:predicted ATPase
MFSLVEARNYRCLRYIRQPMQRFHALIGPNASGKSTYLDVVRFLGDLVQPGGVDAAVDRRTQNWHDLVWMGEDDHFEFAVEARIPEEKRKVLENPQWNQCRYEVRIGETASSEVGIQEETLLLKQESSDGEAQRREPSLFPERDRAIPESVCKEKGTAGSKTVVSKTEDGNDNFYDETGSGWDHAFRLGPKRAALANVPEDPSKFVVSTWFKRMLVDGIEFLRLDSEAMRRPSPPGKGTSFRADGSNLPWVIKHLREEYPEQLQRWVQHIQTSLSDVVDVETQIREEDRHCYLRVQYKSGVTVPSWGLSDGTLRMFALTLLPYLPDLDGPVLIEEPENGIHPPAVETVYESLSSVYDSQVLVATHSPVFLSCAEPEHMLCFALDEEGKTDVVLGSDHPRLREWQHETDLGTLFAGGVLA